MGGSGSINFGFMDFGFVDLKISREPGGGAPGEPVTGSGPGKQAGGPAGSSELKTTARIILSEA